MWQKMAEITKVTKAYAQKSGYTERINLLVENNGNQREKKKLSLLLGLLAAVAFLFLHVLLSIFLP